MKRTSFTRSLLGLLACVLAGAGCGGNEPPGARQPLPERDAIHEIVEPGYWQARGRDIQGNRFEGYLIVERLPEKYMRVGYFDWQTGVAGGRYYFDGSYDAATRTIRWTGFNIQNRFGIAGLARYEAVLSNDGRQLVEGKWSGGASIPGVWSADYTGD